MHTLLFICTTNYYRSRFCEHLFNHLASQQHLDWTAISRGAATELGGRNIGPISPETTRGLHHRGSATPFEVFRYPLKLTETDLQTAADIIALDEAELRPHLELKFPAWADQVTYWQIGDRPVATIEKALALAEQNISTLIQKLSKATQALPRIQTQAGRP